LSIDTYNYLFCVFLVEVGVSHGSYMVTRTDCNQGFSALIYNITNKGYPMSNLVAHARRELDLIGMTESSEPMNVEARNSILAIVELFASQGHSGFSAAYVSNILNLLLKFKPLTPLTGDLHEWRDVTAMSGPGQDPCAQNIRCSSVMRRIDGDCYDVNGIVFTDGDGNSFTNKDSCVPVTFPYVPETKYVTVEG
jgi:hypothetical protein